MYENISLCSLPPRKDVYISSRCLGKIARILFYFSPVHIEFSMDHSSLFVRREYCTIYCVTNLGNLCCIFISKMEMLIRLYRFFCMNMKIYSVLHKFPYLQGLGNEILLPYRGVMSNSPYCKCVWGPIIASKVIKIVSEEESMLPVSFIARSLCSPYGF